MSSLSLPEPPTESTLADARRKLEAHEISIAALNEQIQVAERQLAQIITTRRCAIQQLQQERDALEEQSVRTKAYLAPIRKLPEELLRHIFILHFEDCPCGAWLLASICPLWRKLAISIPEIWSTIRLVTSPNCSPDVLRLWLERSGTRVPLDIEIFLQVDNVAPSPRSRSSSPVPWWAHQPPMHAPPLAHGPVQVLPMHAPHALPPIGHPQPHGLPSTNPSPCWSGSCNPSRTVHWGHIAIFYLVDQMHRWERFIFRFDRQFPSVNALKSITGDAPLLKEFEVSCSEPTFFNEWPWLPSTSNNLSVQLPRLETLVFQYVPFKWTSVMFQPDLTSLTIRSLPSTHLNLDRIMHIIAANPRLEILSLHFTAVLPPILPLALTTFTHLKDLHLGGHYLLSNLADSLILPALDSINIEIEARDPIEDTITNLLARSNNPAVKHFTLAYEEGAPYFFAAGSILSWGFLSDVPHLRSLRVGGSAFEPLLTALAEPDETTHQWLCPNLVTMGMRGCHSQSDGMTKLVQLVERRNPGNGSGATARLKELELLECVGLGQDILTWLKTRLDEVVCTEAAYDRRSMPLSPHFHH